MGSCPACGRESVSGARFCPHCGVELGPRCASCGAELIGGARFCTECGAAVSGEAPGLVGEEGELRQLTVVFSDLVGSTELSARLDPESFGELLRGYQSTATEIAERYGGHVEKYLGDGILFHFGWPEAHDDDPERATRAGLEIVAAMADLSTSLSPDRELAVRVGIHTGTVMIGEVGASGEPEMMAIGETVNLASRLQTAAAPNTVVLSATTLDLVRGIFVSEDLGEHRLKGIDRPIRIYRAVQPSGMRSRFALAPGGLTAFVGRAPELAMLQDRWRRAGVRTGQAVLVTGEAGVGKSRLVYEFHQALRGEAHTWLEGRCSSYTDQSAFHPAIELIEQGLSFSPDDSPDQRIEKLERGLAAAGVRSPDAVGLMAGLLAIPPSDNAPEQAMSPERRRRRTIEVMTEWVLSLAALQPMVLLVEDLQWCDPSTLELIAELVEQCHGANLMVLGTARPGFEPEWRSRSHLTVVSVNPFGEEEIREVVAALSGGRELPEAVVERIVAETDGIPLYAEEVGRQVLESDLVVERGRRLELAEPLAEVDIPTTLQGSLMARLDRLSSAKRVAQLASAIGREFDYRLLEETSGVEPPVLRGGLERLVESDLLYQHGHPPDATFTFKHALIQDAAYQSLLKRTRRTLHERIALALERRLAADPLAPAEIVARHWEGAGRTEKAAVSYRAAAERAAARSGHREAIAHLERAIELVQDLREDAARDELEIGLQMALGSEIITTRSFSDPDVERAYERARELCEERGDDALVGHSLAGLAIYYLNRGRMDLGAQLAERVLGVGDELDDDALRILGHNHIALPGFCQARFADSLAHARSAIEIYEPSAHHSIAYRFGTDQGVVAHCFAGQALVGLGMLDQTLAEMRAGVRLARELDHQFSIAYALLFETTAHWLHGDRVAQRRTADAILEISEPCGFDLWTGLGHVYRAAADAVTSGAKEALPELVDGSAVAAGSGSVAATPPILACVAEAQLAAGDLEGARTTIDGTLALSEATGQPWWDADLVRLKGLVALQSEPGERGGEASGERHLRRAIAVARERGVPVLELRVAMDLARLWAGQGEAGRAVEILGPAYDALVEGHGTPLMTAARDLLAELGAERAPVSAPAAAADHAGSNPSSG